MDPHVVTQEDLDANPLLATLKAGVGDSLTVTKAEEEQSDDDAE